MNLSKISIIIMCSLILFGCDFLEKKPVDLIIAVDKIYTVDKDFSVEEAMAVKDGKIVELGTLKHIQNKYTPLNFYYYQDKVIIPGLYDAHLHFLQLGKFMRMVNLVGTQSPDEMLQRIVDFQEKENRDFIIGHGWDQNNWPVKEFPTKEKLDSLFPDIPVVLTRIDVHAMLVNQKVLELAKIDLNSQIDGGDFIKKDGQLTGVLIDNAMSFVRKIQPQPGTEELTDALIRAQELCFSYGLTSVADAGMTHEEIQLLNQAKLDGKLKIDIYPMLLFDDPHLDDYLFNGLGKNEGVSCRSVKLFGDGALGSRGAALLEPYSDDPENYGLMRVSPDFVTELTEKVAKSDFQLNAHAIGDSTNQVILKAYYQALKDKPNRRWRIEHAQIVQPEDLKYFSENIIPSVQPTHAISDMGWAGDRLGARIKYAYAYKDLLNQAGLLALGTDAPVEEINPYRTFYAATARKNSKGEPKDGFQTENALSREEALRGMTIQAAFAQFEEDFKGSLEPGKQADFVILADDIMEIDADQTLNPQVIGTFVKGKSVYNYRGK